jgi:hypothetical protein
MDPRRFDRVATGTKDLLAHARPWSEVFDSEAWGKPADGAEALSRIRRNALRFRVNYVIVMAVVVMVGLALHPVALCVLGGLGIAWLRMHMMPLQLNGRPVTDVERIAAAAAISVVTIFVFTSAGAVLTSSLLVGLGVVCAHGAMYVPGELFVDDV